MSNQMTPEDPAYVERVRASFARQQVMALIGAELRTVEPGATEIVLPCRPELSQQDGFVHAGVVTTIADSACGYAAFSLMPPGVGVLTVEFKVNLLNPAAGVRLVARGRVVKPGRTLTVCTAEVTAEREDGTVRPVALMQATMMAVRDRTGITE
ncbi:MAG TPA: PaaI family thioesterase [Ktedonobacterales bacterium]|nr:PaaI family thioesterase [Ktedonobacterales bacterium]